MPAPLADPNQVLAHKPMQISWLQSEPLAALPTTHGFSLLLHQLTNCFSSIPLNNKPTQHRSLKQSFSFLTFLWVGRAVLLLVLLAHSQDAFSRGRAGHRAQRGGLDLSCYEVSQGGWVSFHAALEQRSKKARLLGAWTWKSYNVTSATFCWSKQVTGTPDSRHGEVDSTS